MRDQLNADLLARARAGDAGAWRQIVRGHERLVWGVARSHRLAPEDASDVCQATWLALAQHLFRIREPEKLGAWLVVTARNESVRVLGLRGRQAPVDLWGPPDPTPEDVVLDNDRARALWEAYSSLTDRCRQILRLVAHAPEMSYAEIAAALGVPTGSLGPMRSRCLATLRRRLVPELVG